MAELYVPRSNRSASICSVQLMVGLYNDVRHSSSYQKINVNEEKIELNHINPDDSARKETRYGIAITSPETAQKRFSVRKRLLDYRLRICNWSLTLAIMGLVLAVIDAELVGAQTIDVTKGDSFSLALRWMILASTIALDVLILMYHFVEIKISLVDTGSEYWRVGVTSERLLKVLTELVICSMCPLPGTGYVNWPILKSKYTDRRVELPFDVLLCLPMFLRCYILCRFMVLHSAQFQDAATRTIAVLNQITVDFPFVVKTQLFDRPLAMICAFTGSFWFCMAWMLAQCERYTDTDTPGLRHFLNFIWFEIVTFFSIGYGDVVPQTYCGRALAISTGIVGTFVSSLIIALVGRRMQLSLAERRVNQVIAESQLSNSYKNTAASVLQHIWFVHKYRKQLDRHGDRGSKRITFRIRIHQRSLLQAILAFRRVRWRLRMRLEEEDEYIAFRRAYVETQERMTEFRKKQNQLRTQLATLNEKVESLSDIFASPSCIILPPTNQTRKAISAIDLHRLPSI